LSGGRTLWTRGLDGSISGLAPLPGGAAVLLSPYQGIGPTTLAVVRADGRIRTAKLDRIRTGSSYPDGGRAGTSTAGTIAYAGLAVDASRNRAYVVPAGTTVAEVDLDDMTVHYHQLSHRVSVLGRLHDWLEPKAAAKGANGPWRAARML